MIFIKNEEKPRKSALFQGKFKKRKGHPIIFKENLKTNKEIMKTNLFENKVSQKNALSKSQKSLKKSFLEGQWLPRVSNAATTTGHCRKLIFSFKLFFFCLLHVFFC